jgi:hypothetical protein
MSTRLKEIAEKKEKILSKILNVDSKTRRYPKSASSSSPNTHIIAKIHERINNPIFNLTISDYELMCGNKMIIKMMSKVLECDDKQLRAFCKYINVFKENISSSPKNKIKSKMTLNKLPDDLRLKIVEKYKSLFPTKYVLRDWIPKDKLVWDWLSGNPNAIDMLRENKGEICWLNLCNNPEAIELLKEYRKKIDWPTLSGNPNASELLKERIEYENKLNEIEYKNIKYNKICWGTLSGNPNAIDLLKNNKDKIAWEVLSGNPNAIDLLKNNKDKIAWDVLSGNPNAIDLLRENMDEIDWDVLSGNPNAIDLLRENMDEIDWEVLSGNPNAIDLLKNNMDEIDWEVLSGNPNAIDLLRENMDEIDWEVLSGNPAIFNI